MWNKILDYLYPDKETRKYVLVVYFVFAVLVCLGFCLLGDTFMPVALGVIGGIIISPFITRSVWKAKQKEKNKDIKK